MNTMQSYMDAIKPFAEPYLALVDAYSKLLQGVGGGHAPSKPVKGQIEAWEDAAGYAPPTELAALDVVEAPPEPTPSISHLAHVAHGNTWETQRANEAYDVKKAKAKKASLGKGTG